MLLTRPGHGTGGRGKGFKTGAQSRRTDTETQAICRVRKQAIRHNKGIERMIHPENSRSAFTSILGNR